MSNYTSYLLLAILALLIIASLIECSNQPPVQLSTERIVKQSLDSTLAVIDRTSPPVSLRSKLKSNGQRLTLDTILNHDTLRVSIEPDSTVFINLLPAPRLVHEWVRYIRYDSLIRERQIEMQFVERPWYESPLLVLVGAVLGILLAVVM